MNAAEEEEELPSGRDLMKLWKKIFDDVLFSLILLSQTMIHTARIISSMLDGVHSLQNVVTAKVSRCFHTVLVTIFPWETSVLVSDVYHVHQFFTKFLKSVIISYFVLSLRETNVWRYFLERMVVPICTVAVPLQTFVYRQLVGPPIGDKVQVYIIVSGCFGVLSYVILSSFHSKSISNDPLAFTNLLSLLEAPLCLSVSTWKALNVKGGSINYLHSVKNSLILDVLNQSFSPLIGFIVLFRSRRNVLYPLYYVHQLMAWGNDIVLLAVYYSFEAMVSSTFPLLSKEEVSKLEDDDMCPVCLLKHNQDSRRLSCGHAAHSTCLISMLQSGASSKCPICRADIVLNEEGSNDHMPRNQTDDASAIGNSIHASAADDSSLPRQQLRDRFNNTAAVSMGHGISNFGGGFRNRYTQNQSQARWFYSHQSTQSQRRGQPRNEDLRIFILAHPAIFNDASSGGSIDIGDSNNLGEGSSLSSMNDERRSIDTNQQNNNSSEEAKSDHIQSTAGTSAAPFPPNATAEKPLSKPKPTKKGEKRKDKNTRNCSNELVANKRRKTRRDQSE